jgi:hypothetical protein
MHYPAHQAAHLCSLVSNTKRAVTHASAPDQARARAEVRELRNSVPRWSIAVAERVAKIFACAEQWMLNTRDLRADNAT